MKTEVVTDLPMGILLMVLSQFFLISVYNLMYTDKWYTLVAIVICSVTYWRLFGLGIRVAFLGIEIDVKE